VPTTSPAATRWRTIPVEVDAIQWTGDNYREVAGLLERAGVYSVASTSLANDELAIHLPDGDIYVPLGDWIVCSGDGQLRLVPDAEFGKSFEPAPPTPDPDLPPGVYARIELPGYRSHTGWIVEESWFGTQMAVVRNRAGKVIASVAPGPGCQIVHLATSLKEPDSSEPLAITAGPARDWDADYDDPEGQF
jgi:hypothetical protein